MLLDASRGGPGAPSQGRRLRALAGRFLGELGLEGVELSLCLVRDPEIRRLNRAWRDKDRATDVLSFPAGAGPWPGRRPLGDVVLSMDTARRVGRELKTGLGHELSLYLAHGLLHLLGHDHLQSADARRMRRAERRLLGGRGMLARAG